MIRLEQVSMRYGGAALPTLSDVNLAIDEGELVLVTGRTGTGKSTLLGLLNGLVPHFTGGHLDGTVTVDGVTTTDHPPREFAHLVGVVGQDPLAGFVTDIVEDELAYGMEQLGIAPQIMRRRVEETLDLLGIVELRRRALRTLSGGQQQRVAIGSVLAMSPKVLVLDEPTSALDPTAAEEVLSTVSRLVHDLGTTVVLAEHRMERVIPFADRMIYLPGNGRVLDGEPAAILEQMDIAPPIIELGRLLEWSPLPLTIRGARRRATDVRETLGSAVPIPVAAAVDVILSATGIVVRYGSKVAVRDVDLELCSGEVVAVMGRNGSGKSSLLWTLQGSGARNSGTVLVDGADPQVLSSANARKLVGLVPQTASDLLYLESVDDECAAADRQASSAAGTCQVMLDGIAPGIDGSTHPRDLSEGQKLALVLAVQLTAAPRIMLLDEPTRGLDYGAKAELARVIAGLAADGHAIMIATHDVEFAATVADRAIVMAEGEIVSEGVAAEVLGASPAFAPQVAKIIGADWLTVAQVREALDGAAPDGAP